MTIKTLTVTLLLGSALFAETTFEVIQKKRFWPDGQGVLKITEEAIEFETKDVEQSRRWKYQDIQFLDRISPTELALLTYDDVAWQLGRDKRYHFVMVSGELSWEEFDRISGRIGRPVANREFTPPPSPAYEIPAKHLHRFGGCEGTLVFTDSKVFYQTEQKKHAREWQLARDVNSVWSADPYQLELYVYERGRRPLSRTQIYKFDLKQPLDATFYRRLKLDLYEVGAEVHSGEKWGLPADFAR